MAEPKPRLPLPLIASIFSCVFFLIVVGLGFVFWPRTSFGYQESIDSEETLEEYPPVNPMEVDLPAPDLTLKDLEGKSVSLSDYRGKVALVNIWAIWCTPCRAELPVLQEFYEDHQNQDFVVIGIDAGDEVEDIVYHVRIFNLSFPNLQDPNQDAPRAFAALFLPSSYVIDQTGRVRLTWSGAATHETLEQYITPLLEK